MLVTQRGWSEQCDIWHKKKFLDAISSVQMDPDPGEQGVLSEHLAGIMAPMTAAVVVTRVWLPKKTRIMTIVTKQMKILPSHEVGLARLRIGLRLSSS